MEQTRTRRLSVTAKHLQGTDGLRVSIADAFDQVTRLYCTVDALPPACYSARCECSVRLAPAVQSPSTPWVPSLSRSISGGSRRACCEVWTLFGTAPTLCVALSALCHCCHRCLYPPNTRLVSCRPLVRPVSPSRCCCVVAEHAKCCATPTSAPPKVAAPDTTIALSTDVWPLPLPSPRTRHAHIPHRTPVTPNYRARARTPAGLPNLDPH